MNFQCIAKILCPCSILFLVFKHTICVVFFAIAEVNYHMSSLSSVIIDAVRANDDANSIIETFNKLYADAVYPPVQEMQTFFLVASVELKHHVLAEMLLRLGYPVNYKFGYASPSPLHAAVITGNLELIHLLLERGSSVNLRSRGTVAPSDKVLI